MEEKNKNKPIGNQSKFIPLSEAAKLTGYTPEYLNFRCRKGLLKAEKIGRNWHTTVEWVNEFLATIPGKKKIEVTKEKKETPKDSSDWEEFLDEDEEDDLEKDSAEDTPLSLKDEKNYFDIKKILAGASSVVVVMPLIFAMVTFTKFTAQKFNAGNLGAEDKKFFDEIAENEIINENKVLGLVLAEEDSNATLLEKNSGIVLASENYKARELSVGGASAILASAENMPLEISDVRSESFVSGKKEEVKVIVSWKTNKPATSEISYAKNNGQNSKSILENSFGISHSVVLTGLEGKASYVYSVKARDRWGTEKNSDYFGIYTASKPVSIFDLIVKAFGEVFGWAMKK